MKRHHLALIGADDLSGALAHLAIIQKLGDITLFDEDEQKAKAKALDLAQTAAIHAVDINVTGTNNPSVLQSADVVIVAVSWHRDHATNQAQLVERNTPAINSVADLIAEHCCNAFIINLTNPVDSMTHLLQSHSKLAAHKIVGMGCTLDMARLQYLLAREFDVSVKQVQPYIIGAHGHTIVLLTNMTYVAGISLDQLVEEGRIGQERLDELIERTQQGANEIIYQDSSPLYAPAGVVLEIAESYLYDRRMIIPCSTQLNPGMYNIDTQLFMGVPCRITGQGVKTLEIDLTDTQKTSFQQAIDAVKKMNLETDHYRTPLF